MHTYMYIYKISIQVVLGVLEFLVHRLFQKYHLDRVFQQLLGAHLYQGVQKVPCYREILYFQLIPNI